MRRKDYTVELELHPKLTALLFRLNELYRSWDTELIITSGSEKSTRHSRTSLHYATPAQAVDIRTRLSGSMPAVGIQYSMLISETVIFCEEQLIPNDWFDIILESNHIHIEYQPKRLKEFN